jgi:hypothetical protein
MRRCVPYGRRLCSFVRDKWAGIAKKLVTPVKRLTGERISVGLVRELPSLLWSEGEALASDPYKKASNAKRISSMDWNRFILSTDMALDTKSDKALGSCGFTSMANLALPWTCWYITDM